MTKTRPYPLDLNHMALVTGLACSLWLGGCTRPADPAATVEAFHRALAEGQRAQALALLDPEVIVLENGNREASRDEYRDRHLDADVVFAQCTTEAIENSTSRIDGNVATVIRQVRTRGQYHGHNVDKMTQETIVLTRSLGSWRIHHIHWSSRDTAPSPTVDP